MYVLAVSETHCRSDQRHEVPEIDRFNHWRSEFGGDGGKISALLLFEEEY